MSSGGVGRRGSSRNQNQSTKVQIYGDDDDVQAEDSPLMPKGGISLNYNSDSAIYEYEGRDEVAPLHRHFYYGPGTHYATTVESDDEEENLLDFPATSYKQGAGSRQVPRANWRSFGRSKSNKRVNSPPSNGQNRFTRRSRIRSIKKHLRDPPSVQKLRVSAYCTCDQYQLFKLLKWLERIETGQLPGGELNPNGWSHKMYMGAIHATCAPIPEEGDEVPVHWRQKDVFYFATGCTVFWGLTRAEEQAHLRALQQFSVGPAKQVEVEDMDYTYGENTARFSDVYDPQALSEGFSLGGNSNVVVGQATPLATRVMNDAITLSSNRASEKLAISFAMAQSAKLDVFEERVEEAIQETKHVPQQLATNGAIEYSQNDISKLIGRLFIERNDVNLNSDMLDEPDFFWEDDEYQPLYKKMMKYMDVENRVQILNTRLDILRELLDVLSQQLAHQHDTKLEWIVIWLIVAEVVVQIVWNMLIKDILGFFPRSDSD
ncbi:TPA: hypothetical protein N0F65_000045 [Lagenidium giganteum]|uniref:DUF155 domain-containing protein n=1 Tax=Lagenidium giganteum TaxID=4803 RepID=A0AAV2YM31_9STRA|nr:TPA: hypothetical protein N0F65_000045 [Lagenidium giganteum]